MAFFPNTNYDQTSWGYEGIGGDLYLNVDSSANYYPSYEPGSQGWFLLLHELGHALGLKHPHDDGGTGRPTFSDLGIDIFNEDIATIMSYNDTTQSLNQVAYDPATPMVLDVLALQYLFGKNSTTNSDDTVYDLTNNEGYYLTIWDAGGTDQIDASSTSCGWGVFLPSDLGSTIIDTTAGYCYSIDASGVADENTLVWLTGDIENVTGSAFDDQIQGNSLANTLIGGAGDDSIFGGYGDDQLYGGAGNDYISDWMGNDEVYAGDGDDIIINTGGEDLIDGGDGIDTLVTDLSQAVKEKLGFTNWNFDIVLDLAAVDPHMRHYGLTPEGVDYAWDEIYNIENYTLIGDFDAQLAGDDNDNILIADTGDDSIFGGYGDDQLYGGAGNDYISDWMGNDEVYAGDGDDIIINTGGEDLIDGGDGIDTLVTDLSQAVKEKLGFTNWNFDIVLDLAAVDPHMRHYGLTPEGVDYAWDEIYNIENYTLIGDFDAQLAGDDNDNILIADTGDDTLFGGIGDDNLSSGSGDDQLNGGAGNDVLRGGAGLDTFIFEGAFGHDTIYGYKPEEDTLVFRDNYGLEILTNDLVVSTDASNRTVWSLADNSASVTFANLRVFNKDTSQEISDGTVTYSTADGTSNSTTLSAFAATNTTISADYDVDTTGAVGISDVIAQLRHIVGLNTLTGVALGAADNDGDGAVAISDVISSLRQIVGLQESPSAKLVTAAGESEFLFDHNVEELYVVAPGDADLSWIPSELV